MVAILLEVFPEALLEAVLAVIVDAVRCAGRLF